MLPSTEKQVARAFSRKPKKLTEEQMRVKSDEERENAGDDGGTVGNADARKTCGGTASHGFAVSAGGVSLPSIRNAASMSAQTSA